MALIALSNNRLIVAFVVMSLGCGIALPDAVSAGEFGETSSHWLVRAKSERLLAQTIAEASAAKARRLEQLHEQGFAGWTEWAAARSDAARDAARSAAAERMTNWMTREVAATSPTPAVSVSRLELSLPGSRAVLGWVQPDRLSGDERKQVLELLRRRSLLLVEDDSEVVTARRRVEFMRDRVRHLSRPSSSADSVERNVAAGPLRIATARLVVAEAANQHLRSEHETLVSAIDALSASIETRSNIAPETRQQTAVAVRQRARQVLAFESQTSGEIQTARAAKQLARLHVAGCDALRDQQQISPREWQRAQSDLGRSLFGWEQITGLKDWQERNAQQLGRDGAADVVRLAAGESFSADNDSLSDVLTTAQRRDASRMRKAIALMRQWCEATAEVEAAQAERDWRGEVVSRLQTQRTPNDREIEIATAGVALSDGRVQMAVERMQLTRFLWQHESAADATNGDAACELSLIGDLEAGAILDAATRLLGARSVRRCSPTPRVTHSAV